MVATKVLISLCVFGVCLVSGAPQAGSGVSQDEAGIVTNVVTALQPQIAEAVAAALRGLSFGSGRTTSSTSTTTNTVAASNSGPPESTFTAGGRGASTSTGFGFSGSQVGFGSSGSRGGSAGGVGVSAGGSSGGAGSRVGVATGGSTGGSFGASGAAEEVTARASYAYEYKVADDDEQTYISHNEARDGDEVTGQYSYIDPNGDLVTVTYQAGAMGYTQTVDRKVGQVQIRLKDNQRAVVDATSNVGASSTGNSAAGGASSGFRFGSSSSGTGSSGFGASVAALPPPPVVAPVPQVVEETITTVTTTGTGGTRSSGGLDEAALIAQIISVLQPQINQAVTSVITQQ